MRMMIFNVILYLIQVLKYISIYDLFFRVNKRQNSKKIFLFILGSVLLWGMVELDLCNPLLPYALYIIYITIVFYENINVKIIMLGMWLTCVISLLDEITRIITKRLLYMDVLDPIFQNYISNLITLLFLYILSLLVKRKVQGKIEKISFPYYIFFLILTFANTLIIVFLSEFVFKQVKVENIMIAYIAFMGTAVGMFLEMAMVMLLAVSRNVYKEKDELNQKFLQVQQEHYKYLEERELETKKFRHDIRSHMCLVSDLWKQCKYTEAGDYISEIYGRLDELGNAITVNNGIVDAILNKYYSDAKKEKVSMNVCGRLPNRCYIEAFDLCTIFSNLLSNAIDAAKRSSGKSIEVECGYKSNQIVIMVENDFEGEIVIRDGKYVTSKDNKENHGYGLQNIEKSVEKYYGCMNIYSDDRFIVRISLNNKPI